MKTAIFCLVFLLIGYGGASYLHLPIVRSATISPSPNSEQSSKTFTSELRERNRIKSHVQEQLILSKFAELEQLASRYRDQKERSPSGLWNLTHFYNGVGRFADTEFPEANEAGTRTAAGDPSDVLNLKKIDKWMATYPNSPTPYLAKAVLLQTQAWKLRGQDYAHKVREGAWVPFFAKLNEARDLLDRHKATASKDPHWYTLRISIGLETNESADTLMDKLSEGLDKEPYYYQTYFEATRLFLPKWGGRPEYLDAFANMAVEKTAENDGNGMYARILWVAAGLQYHEQDLFGAPNISWDKMKTGMEDILTKYPDNWNVNNFLKFACFAGDREMSRKLLKQMTGTALKMAWGRGDRFKSCKNFALGNSDHL